jgi:hypothetical protein
MGPMAVSRGLAVGSTECHCQPLKKVAKQLCKTQSNLTLERMCDIASTLPLPVTCARILGTVSTALRTVVGTARACASLHTFGVRAHHPGSPRASEPSAGQRPGPQQRCRCVVAGGPGRCPPGGVPKQPTLPGAAVVAAFVRARTCPRRACPACLLPAQTLHGRPTRASSCCGPSRRPQRPTRVLQRTYAQVRAVALQLARWCLRLHHCCREPRTCCAISTQPTGSELQQLALCGAERGQQGAGRRRRRWGAAAAWHTPWRDKHSWWSGAQLAGEPRPTPHMPWPLA